MPEARLPRTTFLSSSVNKGKRRAGAAIRNPGPKISHAAIEASTNPTTAIAKPAKPITAHPPMPSCQGSPSRLLVIVLSSTSAPVTITHRALTTNKAIPVKYHILEY
jgi:hypothetical protein